MRQSSPLMLIVLIVGCSLGSHQPPLVTVASEPAWYAWWLRIEFRPADRAIRGIPVAVLDPSWRFASELRKELIPHELLFERGTDSMVANRLVFARAGDFDTDGVEDLALVGVYEDVQGQRGSFVAVLSRNASGGWIKRFLDFEQGRAGFSALAADSAELEVWLCMECDHVRVLAWDRKQKRFHWEESEQSRHALWSVQLRHEAFGRG